VCKKKVCPALNKVLPDSKCEACPLNKVVSKDGKDCIRDVKCKSEREVEDDAGKCTMCGDFLFPDKDR